MRITLGGAEVDLVRRDEVFADVLPALRGAAHRPLCIVSANLDHLYHFGLDSGREGSFDSGRGGADWLVLLDGTPLVRAARRLTGSPWEQLAGSDLLPDLLQTAARARARVGFLGGRAAHQRMLAAVLADRYPTVDIAGYWAPSRAEVDDPTASAAVADEIRTAAVDLLVVGLGKPRQEEWLLRHVAGCGARVAVAFGSAADFLAGATRRAPLRWRRAGMEWLYRLLHEPGRLVRRYVVQGPSSLYRLRRHSRGAIVSAEDPASQAPMLSTPTGWRVRLGKVLAAGDAIIIALSSLLAYAIRDTLGDVGIVAGFEDAVIPAIAVIPLWISILAALGCYKPQYLNSGGESLRRFGAGAFAGLLGLGFMSFAFNLQLARGYVLMLFAFVLLLGMAYRLIVRGYLDAQRREQRRFLQNVLVVGADQESIQVAAAMQRTVGAGYRVVGFLDDELKVGTAVLDELCVVGSARDVLDVAYDLRAGLVLVSPTGVRPGTLRELVILLEGSPIDVAVAPSLYDVATRRVTFESVSNVPLLHVEQIRLEGAKAVAKRTLDLAVGAALSVVAAPVLAVALIATAIDSGRPVFFSQTRVGRDGRLFTLHKLRTMVPDAEDRLPEVEALNEAGHHFFKIRQDPRVTPVGRVLRKWSLDELPQLWNVLRGDMSLVGPRPPLPSEVEKYDPWHRRRLRIRPGITGVWQVSGRANIPFEEALRMDLFYIENWSIGYDLFLLGKTVFAVLGRRGAY